MIKSDDSSQFNLTHLSEAEDKQAAAKSVWSEELANPPWGGNRGVDGIQNLDTDSEGF